MKSSVQTAPERHELAGGKCSGCGTFFYPHRGWCNACGNEVTETGLSGQAKLHAWTVIRIAPQDFEAPYVVGYACLAEGPRVLVHVKVDPERLSAEADLIVSRSDLGATHGVRSVGLEATLAERSDA